jgi:hypothetical protein
MCAAAGGAFEIALVRYDSAMNLLDTLIHRDSPIKVFQYRNPREA